MKYSELVKIAKQYGWNFVQQDGTSHRVYMKNGERLIIPFHGSKEVPTGTCSKILKIIKGI